MGVMDRGLRFIEIDSIRGVAIILMVIYHIIYNLSFLGISNNIDPHSIVSLAVGRSAAILFIFVAGVSLSLSHSRYIKMNGRSPGPGKYINRGSRIFVYGLMITLVTYLMLDKGTVIFGILHLIGLSVILAYPFLGRGKQNIYIGIMMIASGIYMMGLSFGTGWLLWLGLRPVGIFMLDYFPIFPWFGLVRLGMYAGERHYGGYERRFWIPDISQSNVARKLSYLGRHSLLIYLVHQPIIIAVLSSLSFIGAV